MQQLNIVRPLLDGGNTDDGRPYLVMEYVVGEPITIDADRRALTVRERVELFRRVCAAVAFAHQRLVVHRDLKPSNILVAGDEPKLLDFGIAKLLEGDRDARTSTGLNRFTPAYASPEQVRGEQPRRPRPIVHSLGAVLYHLVSGRPLTSAPRPVRFLAALQPILGVDPPRPERGRTSTDRRRTLMPAIWTKIVTKALRREPEPHFRVWSTARRPTI